MESYELTGKEAPLSDSDKGLARRNRASKLTGYSHDSLSKVYFVNCYYFSSMLTISRKLESK